MKLAKMKLSRRYFHSALIIVILIVHTECQLTIQGIEEINPADPDKWRKSLMHFPMIGKTFFFQYDIFIKGWSDHDRVAAIVLSGNLDMYIDNAGVYYNVKGAKPLWKPFPGKSYINK